MAQLNLTVKERRACLNFVTFRRAISGGAALDHVTDINFFALQTHGLHQAIQELPGTPHKGKALLVFIRTRAFPDEHQGGVRVAFPEYNGLACGSELAAPAVTKVLANLLEGLGAGARRGRRFKQAER